MSSALFLGAFWFLATLALIAWNLLTERAGRRERRQRRAQHRRSEPIDYSHELRPIAPLPRRYPDSPWP